MGKLANRAHFIAPFQVMALLEKAKNLELAGRDVIHLEVGEPDLPTPPGVIAAGIEALQRQQTQYTPATGLPQLKRALADFYLKHLGVSVDPRQIVITVGASGAIQLVSSVLFNEGDGVLLAEPGYPCNDNILRLVGAQPQKVTVDSLSNFQLTADLVAAHWQPNTQAVWLASPSNPTGTMIEPSQLRAIGAQVAKLKGALIVDEIYQGLVYDRPPITALAEVEDQENLFIINSFSKYFTMTGWRLGWMVAPLEHIPYLERMAQNFFLAPPTVAQYAALEALSDDNISVCELRRQQFAQRRDFLLGELSKVGFIVPAKPQGAFYLYCDISKLTQDSLGFCEELLEQQAVAITPGIDFDKTNGQAFVRIAYTEDLPRLAEAIRRIGEFIQS